MCKVHFMLWKQTVRRRGASLHGYITKTSHHSLCVTSAGIITPTVCKTDTCDAGSCLIGSAQQRWECARGIALPPVSDARAMSFTTDASQINDTSDYLFIFSSAHSKQSTGCIGWCKLGPDMTRLCPLPLRSLWLQIPAGAFLLLCAVLPAN